MNGTNFPYHADLIEIVQGLNDLMADLEDIRDDAQEYLEENAGQAVQADIDRMDKALKALDAVAELLESEA